MQWCVCILVALSHDFGTSVLRRGNRLTMVVLWAHTSHDMYDDSHELFTPRHRGELECSGFVVPFFGHKV